MEWTLTFGWGPALVHESAALVGRLVSSPAYQPTRAEAGRLSLAIRLSTLHRIFAMVF
jgi:hypothetical protein